MTYATDPTFDVSRVRAGPCCTFFPAGERQCFLAQDPRMSPLALDTLVASYEDSLGRSTTSASGAATAVTGKSVAAADGSPQLSTRLEEEEGAPLPSAQQGGGVQNEPRFLGAAVEETPFMTTALATEVFRVRRRDVFDCPQAWGGGGYCALEQG